MTALFSNPMFLAMVAASLFGSSMLTSRNGLQYFDSTTGVMISLATTAALFWVLSPFLLPGGFWRLPGFWFFLAMGVMHPFTSMTLSFESTRRLGATVSATVSSVSPLMSALGAVVFLSEVPAPGIVVGTLGVVCGVMVLSWQRQDGRQRLVDPQILLPLATATVRGMAHVVGKIGLSMTPLPLLAGLCTYTVGSTLMIVIKRATGTMPPTLRSRGTIWFVVTGIITGCAILLMYSALSRGTVVVVSPLISTYPVFTLLASLIFYPKEVLKWRIFIGVALVVAGVILISVH